MESHASDSISPSASAVVIASPISTTTFSSLSEDVQMAQAAADLDLFASTAATHQYVAPGAPFRSHQLPDGYVFPYADDSVLFGPYGSVPMFSSDLADVEVSSCPHCCGCAHGPLRALHASGYACLHRLLVTPKSSPPHCDYSRAADILSDSVLYNSVRVLPSTFRLVPRRSRNEPPRSDFDAWFNDPLAPPLSRSTHKPRRKPEKLVDPSVVLFGHRAGSKRVGLVPAASHKRHRNGDSISTVSDARFALYHRSFNEIIADSDGPVRPSRLIRRAVSRVARWSTVSRNNARDLKLHRLFDGSLDVEPQGWLDHIRGYFRGRIGTFLDDVFGPNDSPAAVFSRLQGEFSRRGPFLATLSMILESCKMAIMWVVESILTLMKSMATSARLLVLAVLIISFAIFGLHKSVLGCTVVGFLALLLLVEAGAHTDLCRLADWLLSLVRGVQPQGVELLPDVVTVAIASVVGAGSTGKKALLDLFVKLPNIHKSSSFCLDKLQSWIDSAVDAIWGTTWSFDSVSDGPVREACRAAVKFLDEETHVLPFAEYTKPNRDPDRKYRTHVRAALLDRLREALRGHLAGPKVELTYRPSVVALLSKLEVVAKDYTNFRSDGAMRPEPAAFNFSGKPGVGKTFLIDLLVSAVYARLNPGSTKEEFVRDFPHLAYVRTGETDFWDAFNDSPFTLIDDLGQRKTALGEVSDYFTVVRAVNTRRYVLHCAELERKGLKSFTSYALLTTTNSKTYNIESINFPDAVWRRFDQCFEVFVRPEYANSVGGIDKAKCEQATHPEDVWLFVPYCLVSTARHNANSVGSDIIKAEGLRFHSVVDQVAAAVTRKFAAGTRQLETCADVYARYTEPHGWRDLLPAWRASLQSPSRPPPSPPSLISRLVPVSMTASYIRNDLCRCKNTCVCSLVADHVITFDLDGGHLCDNQAVPTIPATFEISVLLANYFTECDRQWAISSVATPYRLGVCYNLLSETDHTYVSPLHWQAASTCTCHQAPCCVLWSRKNRLASSLKTVLTRFEQCRPNIRYCHQFSEDEWLDLDRWTRRLNKVMICAGSLVTVGVGAALIYGMYRFFRSEPAPAVEEQSGERTEVRQLPKRPIPSAGRIYPAYPAAARIEPQGHSDPLVLQAFMSSCCTVYSDGRPAGRAMAIGADLFLTTRHVVSDAVFGRSNGAEVRFKYVNARYEDSIITVADLIRTLEVFDDDTEQNIIIACYTGVIRPMKDRTNSFPSVPFSPPSGQFEAWMPLWTGEIGSESVIMCNQRVNVEAPFDLPIFQQAGMIYTHQRNTKKGASGTVLIGYNGKRHCIVGVLYGAHPTTNKTFYIPVDHSFVSYYRAKIDAARGRPSVPAPIEESAEPLEVEPLGFAQRWTGEVVASYHLPNRSKCVPSPLAPAFPELDYAPSHKTWIKREGKLCHPIMDHVLKYHEPVPFPPVSTITEVVRHMITDVARVARTDNDPTFVNFDFRRTLTLPEALEGTKDGLISGVPFNTSLGYPHVNDPLIAPHGRRYFIGYGDRIDYSSPTMLLLASNVDSLLSSARAGRRPVVRNMLILKDEVLPSRKVATGKCRVVEATLFEWFLATRMLFGGFSAWYTRFRVDNCLGSGVDVHSDDWATIYFRFMAFLTGCGDVDSWDHSVPPGVFFAVFVAIDEWYGPVDATARWIAFQEFLFAARVFVVPLPPRSGDLLDMWNALPSNHIFRLYPGQGLLFIPGCGIVSGSFLGSLFSSVGNSANIVAGRSVTLGEEPRVSLGAVRPLSTGDDNLWRATELFNAVHLCAYLSSMGIRYTNEDKTGPGTSRHITLASFLRRRFAPGARGVLAPLEITSILKAICWTKKGVDEVEFADVVSNSLLELAAHGSAVYEPTRDRIFDALRAYHPSLHVPCLSWESAISRYHRTPLII